MDNGNQLPACSLLVLRARTLGRVWFSTTQGEKEGMQRVGGSPCYSLIKGGQEDIKTTMGKCTN